MAGDAGSHEQVVVGPQPPLDAVLDAASAFLETEVLPHLEGALALRMRITIRQLALAGRELEQALPVQADQRTHLQELLGIAGSWSELQAELARRIRERSFSGGPQALRRYLEESVRDSLRIDNPKWLADG